MKKSRRAKSDSTKIRSNTFDQDLSTIEWPKIVADPPKCDFEAVRIAFEMVISTRSRDDWLQPQIVMAAQLAKITIQADQVFEKLVKAGFEKTGIGSTGQEITTRHHLHDVWLGLVSKQVVLTQKLSITGLPAGSSSTVKRHAAINPARVALSAVPSDKEIDWIALAKEGAA